MRDRLPLIKVQPDTTPMVFQERLEELAGAAGFGDPRRTTDNAIGARMCILTICVERHGLHRGLIGQAIVSANAPHVQIEARARRWTPDPVTYEVYVQTAKEIFKPLLKQYNRQYHATCRLSIQSQNDLTPKLPPMARKIFDTFVRHANTSMLHPLDWERFYRFVRFCHARRVKLSYDDLVLLLIENRFSEKYAMSIAEVYKHCRGLLSYQYF